MIATILAVLFSAMAVPLFGWADRKIGGDDPNPKSTGFGRIAIYVALCFAVAFLASAPVLWTLGSMAVIWSVYRSLPWKVGGSTTPRTQTEILAAFVRHGMPAIGYGILCLAGGTNLWLPLIEYWPVSLFLAFAVFATTKSVEFAKTVDNTNSEDVARLANAQVETERGVVFGFALFFCGLALAASHALAKV